MNDYRFGNFVCELREKKGLTQADVARMLDLTPAAISKWENGESKPRVDILFRLAEILDVRPEELMAGKYLPEETLEPEAVNRIREQYAYLKKTESHATIGVKLRRLLAAVIDWNLSGILMILLLLAEAFAYPRLMHEGGPIFILLVAFTFPIFFVLRDFFGMAEALASAS